MEKQKVNVDDFINEVMRQTGIRLDKQDPIIVMLAVNKILLEESKNIHQQITYDFQEDMKQISLSSMKESNENSTKIINSAVQATKNAFNNAIEQSANDFVEKLANENIKARESDLKELNHGLNKLKKLITGIAAISIINIVAAVVILLS